MCIPFSSQVGDYFVQVRESVRALLRRRNYFYNVKTISRLAADAPFGVSGNSQEHSEMSSTILNLLSYTGRGARQFVQNDG